MLIDTIDPNNKKVAGVMDRKLIHTSGAWHMAVHGNIIRLKNGELQILVQKRSGVVDIAKNFHDQSIAIQAISGERDLDEILLRGLNEELGLKKGDVDFVQFNKNGILKVEKEYEYDNTLKNNEIIHLYIIKTKANPKLASKRVRSIKWLNWDKFVDLTHKPGCTKSVRMYTWNNQIRVELERAMVQFLKTGKINHVIINKGLRSFSTDKFYDL